jgi:predicted Zn-dependent peptidase
MYSRFLLAFLMFANLAARTNASEWIHFPSYQRTVLNNGVTLLIMEKHGTPLITVTMALKTGSLQDPTGKEGLADITNDLLRKGAGNRTAEQISEDLDFIGATLDTSATYELTRVHTEFLKKDLTPGIELFSDLILRPTFPQAEVDKLLKQRVDTLKAAKDEPLEVIGHYYQQFLFGSHPYGRPPGGDEQSTDQIKREDIVQFHEVAYVSSNMVIAACGDFNAADMEKTLTSRFGSLAPKSIRAAIPSNPVPVTGTRLELLDKPDSTQTFFRFGNTGISMTDPDRVVVDIVNTLFGGRFTKKLNTALRFDSGLTFGVFSNF